MATIEPSPVIDGVIVVRPDMHGDERGYFIETYRREWFPQGREMIQGNRGDSQTGAIVGCTTTCTRPTTGTCPRDRPGGAARPAHRVAHRRRHPDRRPPADDIHPTGVFIPPGVAHGFAALTDMTMTYLVDGYYNPTDERGVAWNDPAVQADWGLADPILSTRDQSNPLRSEIEPQWQPHYGLRP